MQTRLRYDIIEGTNRNINNFASQLRARSLGAAHSARSAEVAQRQRFDQLDPFHSVDHCTPKGAREIRMCIASQLLSSFLGVFSLQRLNLAREADAVGTLSSVAAAVAGSPSCLLLAGVTPAIWLSLLIVTASL